MANVIISPNLGSLPRELIEMMGINLPIQDLGRLSRVSRRLRAIILRILVQQSELDLPPEAPLGQALNVTVINLRNFFKPYAKPNPSHPELRSLNMLLGFNVDLSQCKITLSYSIALRHLGLVRYALSRIDQELPSPLPPLAKSDLLSHNYRAVCEAKRFKVALMILDHLQTRRISHQALQFLLAAVQAGEIAMVQKVEEMTEATVLQLDYRNSSEELIKAACRSNNISVLAHIYEKIKNLSSRIPLQYGTIQVAYNTATPKMMDLVFDLASEDSSSEILKGAYLTRNIPSIQDCIQRLKLQSPHRKELSYASQTGDPVLVEFALSRIDLATCDRRDASKKACEFYHPSVISLLVKHQLFDLGANYLEDLEKLFQNAQNKGELEELLKTLDSMDTGKNAYIFSTSLYTKAKERCKIEGFKKDQALTRQKAQLEPQLKKAIQAGNLENVKQLLPQDAVLLNELMNMDTIRLPLLFSATSEWASKEHLNILLYFIGKGFKVVRDDLRLPNQIEPTLKDIERFFLQACRLGHLDAAKVCLQEMSRLPNRDSHLNLLQKSEFQVAALMSGESRMIKFVGEIQRMASFDALAAIFERLERPEKPSILQGLKFLGNRIILLFYAVISYAVQLWNFLRGFVR
ncbi:MAG: hypothetical protein JSS10_07210 [Verrucomicrobia bacterium]|nr:hypothetical protein [Verrucomicrobiota bacterium]